MRLHTSIAHHGNKLLLFILAVIFSLHGNAQGTWTPLNNVAPDYNAGVMILLTDGTVLCKTSTGDTGSLGNTWDKLTPDAHGSYINGTWSTIAPMHDYRLYFSCQVLLNGQLYVAGGEYGGGGDKGEVYNPLTNVWTECPQIVTNHNISDANSELLPDGTVLQAEVDSPSGGSYFTRLCWIYNPTTNTYATTSPSVRGDNEAMWVKQPDNSILYIDNYSTTSERYIPATHTWITDANLPVELYDPYGEEAGAAFLLPNGKSWFIGSQPYTAYYTPSGTTSPGTWTAGPALPNNQGAPDAAAAMMVNGKILMNLSPTPTSPDHFPDSTTFYEFDYTTNTYTMVSAPGSTSDTIEMPTYYTNMLCLPDGTILYCSQGDDQYYEYVPGSAALAAGQPTISSITRTNCNTYMITGTLFNGITEGAGYGDDWQMETNYPIVQLSSGTNVYYARTTNWNRPGAVMTGAALDTATFTLPTGLPYGTYAVKVIVNGNPSAPSSINTNPVAITPSTSTVCTRNATTYADALSGGTWSTVSSAIATVGTSGAVTGVSAGSTTISYTIGTCVSVATVSVLNSPAVITPAGPIDLCAGATVTLNDATSSGIWSSGAVATAAVGIGGLVTSASAGTAVISYSVSNGCFSTDTIVVNPVPFGISGSLTACIGSTTNLNDPTSGGTWSSSNSSVALIGSSSGTAIGLSLGSSTISYVLPTGCSTSSPLNISNTPTAIIGAMGVCAGATTGLSDGITGGTWSTSNALVATVGSSSGSVGGLVAGTATITYSLGTGCTVTAVVTVNPAPDAITGASSICVASSTTLGDLTSSGTWSSSSTGVATIDPVLGSVTGIGVGTSLITYVISDGCMATTPISVLTTPAAITGSASVCEGSSTLLTDPSSGGTWSSLSSTVSVGSGSGLVSGLSYGSATVTYTLGGACSTTSVITINNSPGAITGSPMLCVGLNTSLSDPAIGGTWSSGSTSIATVGSGSGTVTGVSTGTDMITYDLGAGCVATMVVTVNTIPTAIFGATTFCSASTSLLSDGVSGGAWSSSNTAIATVDASSGLVSGVSSGSATITYSLGAGCVATTAVTLVSSPSAIIGTTSVCTSGTSTLSDGIAGGTWTSTNTAVATIDPVLGTTVGVATGTSVIYYSLGTGCVATTTLTVTPPTSAPITGATSVCLGQTTALADATTGGTWLSTDIVVATVNSSGVVTGLSPGAFTISYTVPTACGTAYATNAMTVNTAPVVAVVTGTPTACIGATTTLSDATGSGVWSSSNTAVATVGSLTGVVTGTGAGAVIISYSVTNLAGCTTSAESTITITTPLPAIITPSGPTTYCRGGHVLLSGTAGTGLVYQWAFNGSNILGATTSAYTAGSASGGVYTLEVNSGSGCISVSTPLTVTVDTSAPMVTPIVNISEVPGNVLCLVTTPVTFTASAVYGGVPSYQWFVNGTATASGTTYTYSPANGDVVKALLTSNYVCASPDTAAAHVTMTISPDETPSVTVSASPGSVVCAREEVTVTAAPTYGGASPSYLWTKNGVTILTGPSSYTYAPVNGDVIKCTITSDYACLSTNTATSGPLTLTVNPTDTNEITITVSESVIGAGQVDTFRASAPYAGSAPVYQWLINGSAVPGATSSVYVTSSLANEDVVSCEVTSSNICADPGTAVSGGLTIHVGATGISTVNTTGGFTLDPNPSKGIFTISGTLQNTTDETVSILVTDMLGQTVYQAGTQATNGNINQRIQLSNTLANGMYLVSITSGADHVIFHVVIDK